MRLGIGTYTFAWAIGVPGTMPARPMSAGDLLDTAARLGVRVVQFCDNLPLAHWPEPELDALRQRVRQLGLEVEIGARGLAVENLRAHLRLARRFGARFLRLVVDRGTEEPSAEEAVARLKAILPEFAAAGVRLALENHDRFSCATLAWMVEQLGRDQAGICLDTVNSFGALEGPETVVRTLAPYTLNLHVKDFTLTRVSSQMGFHIHGCPAGQGRLNVPWLLDQLRTAGRDVNAILELWTPFGPTLDDTLAREAAWAEASVRYLRTLLPD
jgi:sugar phosphate isomerase/epimerase